MSTNEILNMDFGRGYATSSRMSAYGVNILCRYLYFSTGRGLFGEGGLLN